MTDIPQKRALVVEDNEFMRGRLAVFLKKQGYEVETAEKFLSGLTKAREGFDLVVTDVQLSDRENDKGANKNEGLTIALAARMVRDDTAILVISAEAASGKIAIMQKEVKDIGGRIKFLQKNDTKFLNNVFEFVQQNPSLPSF